ncbi:MAG: translocation/assembly module TamB domain-containing protein [Balneolaceae bacterium]|nr:translocation/assembly module TamB domain-containing protein [Balneolaceae bacterium]
MSEEKKENSGKGRKVLKWSLILIVLLALLAAGSRLLLKSDWLFEQARGIAVEQVNQQVNGTLDIGSIRGDLLNGFTIYDLSLRDLNDEPIATADSISVSYSLMSVIRSPHTIDRLEAGGLEVFITEEEDSVWNVMKLVDLDDDPEETEPVYWEVSNLSLASVNVFFNSESFLPDGFLNIRDLNADLMAGAGEDGFYGTARSLELALEEARLPQPIDLFLKAEGSESRVTLEELVLNSGRTLFSARAKSDFEEMLEAGAELEPVSWEDLAAYIDDLPLRQDLRIELSAGGSFSDLNVNLLASAEGINRLELGVNLSVSDEPEIRSFSAEFEGLNATRLTGIDNLPEIGSFRYSGSGSIFANRPEDAEWDGDLHVQNVRYDEYRIDRFELLHELKEGYLTLNGSAGYSGEEIRFIAAVESLFGDEPSWEAEIESRELNLATWLNDEGFDSELTLKGNLNGRGFSAEQFVAELNFELEEGRYGEQPFGGLEFTASADHEEINAKLEAKLDQSRFAADLDLNQWQSDLPEYSFDLRVLGFDLREITGFDDFPTRLNGSLRGEGRSFDPEKMELTAVASLDSSFVNREEIETLSADISLSNSTLFVENAILESPIADGEFRLRQHIFDLIHPENRLNFEVTLKDLQSLAPLAGLERLESSGTVKGELIRRDGTQLFISEMDLGRTVADSLFQSERIRGTLEAALLDEPEIEASFEITEPFINEFGLEDVRFFTKARIKENETEGEFEFDLTGEDGVALHHLAVFSIDSVRTLIHTRELDFMTSERTLSLVSPFDINLQDEVVSIDTLMIRGAEDDAFLSFWAPHVSAERQSIGLDARLLDIGELQSLVMEEVMVGGFLSGSVEVENSEDDLNVIATGILERFEYASGIMDSLRFDAELQDEWLNFDARGHHDGERLFSSLLRVPFIPDDPLTFDEEFFERDVEGYFELDRTDINYWLRFADLEDLDDTEGLISARFDLGGKAGNPELTGILEMHSAVLSGVEIDSLSFDLNYIHEEAIAELRGRLDARDRRLLDMDAKLPFKVDLREAEILLPDDDDEVELNLVTNNLDLALFNDFLDPDMLRQIRGTIDGRVSLSGTIANLETDGSLELRNGSIRVVPAGITISEIGSVMLFHTDRVELQQFSMRSGPGRIRANGFVELDNLVPGDLQFNIRGTQFRAANTAEYNAIIDLTAAIAGTVEEPSVTGNLSFLSGFVNLQNFGERAVEDVTLEDEEEPDPIDFYDAMAIEMNVSFDRQFFIRNRQFLDMEIELGGEVDLVKAKGEELQMFGSLEGVRGFARPLGRNFELEEAVVGFFGPIDNPELNIRTRYIPPQARTDVRIFYVIDGTVQDPEFRFESEPQLELQDIISYTLFGKPFYELESWEQVMAGSGGGPSAGNIAVDLLLDRVEMLAAQRLGIDVVQIDNTRSGSDSTTSIKTGWYLNRRTFFAILNEISSTRPKTLFMLEYMLLDNLELIITQGDDSREGIDLRWRYDY